MGAEQSSEAPASAPAADATDAAAAKMQAHVRGMQSRREAATAKAATPAPDQVLEIAIERKKKGILTARPKLGIELDVDNKIVSLMAPAANSDLKVGDTILEVDGVALGEQLFMDVLQMKDIAKTRQHVLKVSRPAA